jgi:hypothetical protein
MPLQRFQAVIPDKSRSCAAHAREGAQTLGEPANAGLAGIQGNKQCHLWLWTPALATLGRGDESDWKNG